jgi:hypothetical protein
MTTNLKQHLLNTNQVTTINKDQFLLAVSKIQEIATNNRQEYPNLDTTKLDMVMIDEYELLTWLCGYDSKVILDLIPIDFELNKCIANVYYIL